MTTPFQEEFLKQKGTQQPSDKTSAVKKVVPKLSPFQQEFDVWKNKPNLSAAEVSASKAKLESDKLNSGWGQTKEFVKALPSSFWHTMGDVVKMPYNIAKSIISPSEEVKQQESLMFPKPTNTYEKITTGIAHTLYAIPYRFFQPMFQPYADTLSQSIASKEFAPLVANGKMTIDDFNKAFPALQKTNLQAIGESVEAGLAIYAPEFFGSEATALASKPLKDALMGGFKKSMPMGLAFGTANVLASGTTDPAEITKMISTSMLGMGLIGAVTSGAIPMKREFVEKYIDKVKKEHNLPANAEEFLFDKNKEFDIKLKEVQEKEQAAREAEVVANRVKAEAMPIGTKFNNIPKPSSGNILDNTFDGTKQTLTDPLISEAKKYKSAEEFVKAKTKLNVKNVSIDSLPDRATAIGMPKDKFDLMAKDIKENGVRNPIVIDKNTGQVMDGQTRAFVSQQLGIKEIPAIYIDSNKFNSLKEIQDLSNGFSKTKSQLTDIWNKAQEEKPVSQETPVKEVPVKEEPKTFGKEPFVSSEKEKDISTSKKLGGDLKHKTENTKAQRDWSRKAIKDDYEGAKNVTADQLPDGVEAGNFFKELRKEAEARGDSEFIRTKLGNHPLVKEASKQGTGLQAWGEAKSEGSFGIMEEVRKSKEAELLKETGETDVLKAKETLLDKFLKVITCKV